MANVETATEEAVTKILSIVITKAKASIDVDLSALPAEIWSEAVYRGIQDMLQSGMTKVKTKDLEGEELEKARQDAYDLAQTNLQAMYDGTYKLKAVKKVKVKGKEKTRAMQKAKAIVKAKIKAQGLKISHYTARSITEAAEMILEKHPELIEEARKELEAEERAALSEVDIDVGKVMKPDAKKVKAANEKAAADKILRARKRKEQGTQARA